MINKVFFTLLLGLIFCSSGGMAQSEIPTSNIDSQIEAIRSDARASKVSVINEAMDFNAKESKEFWPIYRKYDSDLSKLDDDRIDLVKSYAAKYRTLSDDEAREFAEKALEFESKRTELRKQYFEEFSKKLPAKTVAKFFQLEHRLDLLIDVEIASQLPMVMKGTPPQGAMMK